MGSIELGGHNYSFPLPKYAVPQGRGEGRFYFVAFVSPAELDDYFNRELAKAENGDILTKWEPDTSFQVPAPA